MFPNTHQSPGTPKLTSDLAANQRIAREEAAREAREKRNRTASKVAPIVAFIVTNVVFISLDIRVYDAVLASTGNILLSILTIVATGLIALLWWDIFLPHARRQSNGTQKTLTVIGMLVAIVMTAILAFMDYARATLSFNTNVIWGLLIFTTVVQGTLVALFWMYDDAISAEAAVQQAMAERDNLQRTVSDFKLQIIGMQNVLKSLESLTTHFSDREEAANFAEGMGYTILASMMRSGAFKPSLQPPVLQAPRIQASPRAEMIDTSPQDAPHEVEMAPRNNGRGPKN